MKNPYASRQTASGAPIQTIADQKALEAMLAQQQQAAPQYNAPRPVDQIPGQPVGAPTGFPSNAYAPLGDAQPQPAPQPAFPGTNPNSPEPGLLAQALDYAQQAFKYGQDNFGGQLRGGVAPENNPLADPEGAPGTGFGGRQRQKQIDKEVDRQAPTRQRR